MRRYPVFLNYDPNQPVGFLELDDEVPEGACAVAALVPRIELGESVKVLDWGLIRRTSVDTRPDKGLGE